ncbi:MAG: hypothetical protein WD336_07400 [Trueperaceae bacterium]
MTEHLLDPDEAERPALHPTARASLARQVADEARALAARGDVSVVCEEARRTSDLALLVFHGERSAVLQLVGDWEPRGPFAIQIAHAGPRGVRYELALYAVVDPDRVKDDAVPSPRSGRGRPTIARPRSAA